MQQEFIKETAKKNEDYDLKFEKLNDLIEIKDKYQTSIPKCIETEIYPFIKEDMTKNITFMVEKKLNGLRVQYVSQRDYEYKMQELDERLKDTDDR